MFKNLILLSLIIKIVLSSTALSSISYTKDKSVKFTIENPSNEPLKILKWGTPLDVQKDMFQITDPSGKLAAYTGVLLYRTKPQPEDFVTVKAKSSHSIVVDLSTVYEFKKNGRYTVMLNLSPYIELKTVKKTVNIFVKSAEEDKIVDSIVNLKEGSNKKTASEKSRINCSANDNRLVNTGVSLGNRFSSCAQNCLGRRSCNSLYATWFGAMNTNRYSRATSNFQRITSAWRQAYRVHCRPSQNCRQNVIAWVYPTDRTRTIYLCDLFFRRGNNDAGHTMLHEMAHFDSVAATRDHCYGRSACMNLARNDPNRAIACADNHAYFGVDCR